MRLTQIRVKNFRSIFDDGRRKRETLELSPHGNYLAGPNNVGKSNIIRALQLALRPGSSQKYHPDTDIPKQKKWAYPTITLDFQMQRKRGPYKTLLKYVDRYEKSVQGVNSATYASNEFVRFHVQYTTEPESRQELFLASGAGSRKGDQDLLDKALQQFYEVVRLVDIESGESLEGLLQRGFDELFTTVLSERFRNEIDNAHSQRRSYKDQLERSLLGPVASFIEEEIPSHVPGVESVRIDPNIESLDDALANVDIHMDDAVDTPLEYKGTGVRAAVIQMFMSFIANSSRRAVVFAIEEPEVFLHPEGHASLGDRIESFTDRSDISLVVTTHSPFILAKKSEARVFTVSKRSNGQTIVERSAQGESSIREARQLLTGSATVPTALDIIESVPEEARLILVVEGRTDRTYLRTAAKLADDDLLDSIHIAPSEGADTAVKDAVVLRAIFEEDKDVAVLLDDDGVGTGAYQVMTGKLKFQGKYEASKYSRWQPKYGQDVEAEDLFDEALIKSFVDEYGRETLDGYMERRKDGKHFEITSSAKEKFCVWVEEKAQKRHCETWIELLDDLRSDFGL